MGIRNPDESAPIRQGGGAGVSVGYVIEMENGFKIYHSGDTSVFGDMALIRELHKPDLASQPCMLPHGAQQPAALRTLSPCERRAGPRSWARLLGYGAVIE